MVSLRGTSWKFERRFRQIEQWLVEQGRTPAESMLEKMDGLWEREKREEQEQAAH